ncbi:MAG: MogA/MoaB family molybdenum cofactor biosynthesis protein [Lachnospiraceae bacterium]|jgi:molybdenum cofactor synthesis domain-containing protein|nr:MogA/MoaB family molybdenum cofactor biosynthesis protein [Lachnospiraceae bacterium]
MAIRFYVITASDSGSRGERTDESGPLVRKLCEEAGYEYAGYQMLPDDREKLSEAMRKICDGQEAELILTTGGTGFAPSDVTPEATKDIIEKETPGIPEAIRADSMKYTPRAMLSRAAAGIRKGTLIVNLPGSPKAVGECLEFLLPALQHGLEILTGSAHECARK